MFNRNASPDKDDTLIVFRGDGNIIVDSSVRQEFARLHSDDHGWLLPRVPSVPLYEWLKPDDTPYEHGRAFVIAREGPHPDRDDEFKSWTVKIIFAAAAVGNTWRQRSDRRKRAISLGFVTACLALVFALTMTVMPLIVEPTIEAPEQPVVAEQTAEKTGE